LKLKSTAFSSPYINIPRRFSLPSVPVANSFLLKATAQASTIFLTPAILRFIKAIKRSKFLKIRQTVAGETNQKRDGYEAALTNFNMISSKAFTPEEVVVG
jgi:hypothetical protein